MQPVVPKLAYDGSYYLISGTGGDLNDWVNGYEDMLEQFKIGKPVQWFTITGKEINEFAGPSNDPYPDDLMCLTFPLDGLAIAKLAMFKINLGDRWFDDVIDNMRNHV